MNRHRPQPFCSTTSMKSTPELAMPPSRDVLRDSGIGLHPHPPFNPAITPQRPRQHNRAFHMSKDNTFSRTPSPDQFDVAPTRRTSSPRPELIHLDALKAPLQNYRMSSSDDRHARFSMQQVESSKRKRMEISKAMQVTSQRPPVLRIDTGTTKTKSSRSYSTSTSLSSATTNGRDIDPFAPRPRIPRGDCTFSVSESPSGNHSATDSSPLAPINFSCQNRGQGSDASSEEFSYGLWGSYPKCAVLESPSEAAMAKKLRNKKAIVRNKEIKAHKHRCIENAKKILKKSAENVSTDTLESLTSFEDEFEISPPSLPREEQITRVVSMSSSEDASFRHGDRLQNFSQVMGIDRPMKKVSGSLLSTHYEAYSPSIATAPIPPRQRELPVEPQEDGNKAICTSFHIQAGSIWVVYVDGMKVAGSGTLNLEVDIAHRGAGTAPSSSMPTKTAEDRLCTKTQENTHPRLSLESTTTTDIIKKGLVRKLSPQRKHDKFDRIVKRTEKLFRKALGRLSKATGI